MELWCENTNAFLELVNDSFSVQANSQLQDLQNYTCLNSFDIEIILNEQNKGVIDNDWYCLLINNGVPLFRGRLIYIGGTADTIKCVYQALPNFGCFENFEFKDNLSDYFYGISGERLSSVADVFDGYDYRGQKDFPRIQGGDITSIYGSTFRYYMINWKPYTKKTIPAFINLAGQKEGELSMKSHGNTTITPNELVHNIPPVPFQNVAFTPRGFAYIEPSSMLRAMGIEAPVLSPDMDGMLVYMKNKAHYLLKVYLEEYQTWDSTDDKYRTYHCNKNSKILLQDTEDGIWDDDKQTYDCQGFFINSIRRGTNSNNPRDRESYFPFEVSVNRLDWLYEKKEDSTIMPHYDDIVEEGGKQYYRLQQKFDSDSVINYEKNTNFYITDGQVANEKPYWKDDSIVVAYVDCEFELDWPTYQQDWTHWQYIPLLLNQWTWMDVKTSDFLNQLSLNSAYWKKLRNPMFITKENKQLVHGLGYHDVVPLIFELKDEQVIECSVDIDTDADKILKVGYDNGKFGYEKVKHLNNYVDNDATEISQTFISHSFKTYDNSQIGITPPYYYENKEDYSGDTYMYCSDENKAVFEIEFKSTNIKGFFCTSNKDVINDPLTDGSTYTYWCIDNLSDDSRDWNANLIELQEDDANYDYVNSYCDHSRKYTIKCVGYQFQERVKWNDTYFQVAQYKTDDMVVFSLTLYKE